MRLERTELEELESLFTELSPTKKRTGDEVRTATVRYEAQIQQIQLCGE
jgi:hypothetical protein